MEKTEQEHLENLKKNKFEIEKQKDYQKNSKQSKSEFSQADLNSKSSQCDKEGKYMKSNIKEGLKAIKFLKEFDTNNYKFNELYFAEIGYLFF